MFGAYNSPRPIDHDDLSNRFRNANSFVSSLDRMFSSKMDAFLGVDDTAREERNLQSLLDRNIEVNEEGNYSPHSHSHSDSSPSY